MAGSSEQTSQLRAGPVQLATAFGQQPVERSLELDRKLRGDQNRDRGGDGRRRLDDRGANVVG